MSDLAPAIEIENKRSVSHEIPSDRTAHFASHEEDHNLWNWKGYEKFTFRIFFTYIILLCIPTDLKWYTNLTKYEWSELHWNMLYNIAASGRLPQWLTIETESGRWGLFSYSNLILTFLVSTLVALAWTYLDRNRKEYNKLYYWVRVLARYQVGFSIVAWGYRKLVPLQMIWPPKNILNTPLLYIQEQKLYWQSVGIVTNYEIFLGFAEVLAGGLLLFRKTTALGGALTAVVLLNIAIANHAYDGGVHIHSITFAVVGAIILWKDLPNIWNLLVKERDIVPEQYYPSFELPWQKYTRLGLKVVGLGLFVVLEFLLHLWGENPYRVPSRPGLAGAEGYYNVTEFRLNNKTLPYSPFDSVRWQDVVFEKWATIAVKVNREEWIDQSNGGTLKATGGLVPDFERGWENAGVEGRHFFYSIIDTDQQVLHLQNKNKAHKEEKLTLHYERPTDSRIILKGINEFKDSIYVQLDRINKVYPVEQYHRTSGVY